MTAYHLSLLFAVKHSGLLYDRSHRSCDPGRCGVAAAGPARWDVAYILGLMVDGLVTSAIRFRRTIQRNDKRSAIGVLTADFQ